MELNTGDSIHIDRGDKFLFVWFLIIKYVSSRKYSKFIFVIWWKEKSISELKLKLSYLLYLEILNFQPKIYYGCIKLFFTKYMTGV